MRPWLIVVAVIVAAYAAYEWFARQPVVTSGTVVVTGASSGIGRDAAFALARRGFHVFATYRRDSDRVSLEQEAAHLDLSARVAPLHLEVSKAESVDAAVRTVEEATGSGTWPPLIAVVNNAGIGGGGAPLELDTDANLRAVMEINFFGAMRVMRAFLPALRRTKGRLVSMSSLKGSVATPGSSGYCASKAALDIATRVAAREMYHLGVTLVTVQPGYIKTSINDNVPASTIDAQFALATSPAGRLYPGFHRYLNSTFGKSRLPPRGVPASVTSDTILFAISARWPGPLLRAGGLEVFMSTWVTWLMPDVVEDAFASFVFRYGEEFVPGAPVSLLARVKRAIGA